MIRHTCLVVVGLFAVTSCDFQESVEISLGETAQKAYSLSAASEGITGLFIDWDSGNVTVIVDDTASSVTATGEKTTLATTAASAQASLEDIEITLVTHDANPARLILAFSVPDPTPLVTYAANVRVVLPTSLVIEITHDLGEVTVTNNADFTTIELDVGRVTVTGQLGDTTVDADAATVAIESAGGSVKVDVDTGSIIVKARPAIGESVVVRLDAGTIDLAVPAETAASLTLDVDIGGVDVDLFDFVVTDLVMKPDRITGILNGGGATINCEVDIGAVSFYSL